MNLEADRESRQTRETKLNDFQKIVSDKGNIRNGCVCIKDIAPITPVYTLEN